MLLSSEDIYRSISELLVLEDNLKFARLMVETLSTILLTSRYAACLLSSSSCSSSYNSYSLLLQLPLLQLLFLLLPPPLP